MEAYVVLTRTDTWLAPRNTCTLLEIMIFIARLITTGLKSYYANICTHTHTRDEASVGSSNQEINASFSFKFIICTVR